MIRPLAALGTIALLVSTAAASGLRFSDATRSSGVEFTMTCGKLPSRTILEVNGGGVALFDYDEDGDLDLFLANGATLDDPEHGPGSRLWANAGDGTFRDVTAEVGLALRRWAMGVAVGDYDGDGDDDLYVTCYGPSVLLRNDRTATGRRFVDVTARAGVGGGGWATSAAFGDLDADGDADLYVTHYLRFDVKHPPGRTTFLGVNVMAGPAGLPPEPDVLYENLGDGKFRDVFRSSGCTETTPGYGLGVRIFDFDRDGRLDVFVGNDSTENYLFHNLGGMKFQDVGVASGVASNYDGATQATMGVALGDVDGNGYGDLFTTNFSSDTDTLQLNLGDGFFEDRTSQYGLGMVTRPFLSWGTGLYDFDSDGDEDLFIASGHVYPETATHKMDTTYEQPLTLFERAGPRFIRDESAGEVFKENLRGRSVAFGDLDDDGDVDVVVTTLNGPVRVLRNDAPRADVVVVELRDRRGSRFPHGAAVELTAGERAERRWIGGGSYQSVEAPVAYFGLGAAQAAAPLTLRVTWPGGRTQEVRDVPVNRRITIRDGVATFESAPLRGRTPAGSAAK